MFAVISLTCGAQTLSLQNRGASQWLVFDSDPGQYYQIQASTNLNDWENVILVYTGTKHVEQAIDLSGERKFFRTVIPDSSVDMSLDSISPIDRTVVLSQTEETKGIVLGVFDLKLGGLPGVMDRIDFRIRSTFVDPWIMISGISLRFGTETYVGELIELPMISNGLMVRFSGLNKFVQANSVLPMTLVADIKADPDQKFAGATLMAECFIGSDEDSNLRIQHVSGAPLNVHSRSLSTGNVAFWSSHLLIESKQIIINNPILIGEEIESYALMVRVALTAGMQDVYVSKNADGAMLYTLSLAEVKLTSSTAFPEQVSGDTQSVYKIPAGTTRSLTWIGYVAKANVTPQNGLVSIMVHWMDFSLSTECSNCARLYLNLQAFAQF